jgi:hypothetical protein
MNVALAKLAVRMFARCSYYLVRDPSFLSGPSNCGRSVGSE